MGPLGIAAVVLALLLLLFLGMTVFLFEFAVRRKREKLEKLGTARFKGDKDAVLRALEALAPQQWDVFSADGLRLRAQYFAAETPTPRTVLCIHGYGSTGVKDFGAMVPFYHRLGWNVLLPDDRAHGASEGEFIGFGWLDRLDCIAWVNELCKKTDGACTVVLHGISMGSATVLMAAGEASLPPCVKAVVSDCGYSAVWDQLSYQMKQMFHLPPVPLLNAAGVICRARAGYSLKGASTVEQVKKIKAPVLFIHGSADTFVPTAMAQTLYDACGAPKEIWIAPGAKHAASYETNCETYEQKVTAFLQRHIN